MRRVLLAGATGAVGTEIASVLAQRDVDLVRVARSEGDGVVSWRIGEVECPSELRDTNWDVVVNAAAQTRWNQTPPQAMRANVASTIQLLELCGPDTLFVQLSTAHAVGLRGSVESDDLSDFRNPYEWSKAAAERAVGASGIPHRIVRFPIVFGRRSDGHLARYSGLFKVFSAATSGLAPALVGRADALFDVVPVDEVAAVVARVVVDDPGPMLLRIGAGAATPCVGDVVDLVFGQLERWRAAYDLAPIVRPPLLDPDRWHRFYLPFARTELSAVQLKTIDLFSEFEPYFCITTPFECDVEVGEITSVIEKTVWTWAERHRNASSREQMAWR